MMFPPSRSRALTAWRSAPLSLALLAGGLAAWGLSRLLPHLTLAYPGGYGAGPGGAAARALSLATGIVPVSVADLLYLTYAAWLAVAIGTAVQGWRRGERRARDAARGGALRICRHAGVALLLFYALWGMNYARPPLAAQMGWASFTEVEPEELLSMLERTALALNAAYLELHGTEDAGVPTALAPGRAGQRELERAIDEGWRVAATAFGMPARAGARHGNVKWAGGAGTVTRVGFRGNYVFFTGEANVVSSLPAVRLPVVMGHEKAHQRGVSRESDANFLGFVAAARAPHPLGRYAAAAFAYSELLHLSLQRLPREELVPIHDSRLVGVKRDNIDFRYYRAGTSNRVTEAATAVNQRYLVSQGVPQGREDYRRSVYLVVEWMRASGWPDERGGPGVSPAGSTTLTANRED